ncbi:MFS transporter [Pseudomonadota bacterium]|nr:MFS transporter [Pseudomonadota bacterium]
MIKKSIFYIFASLSSIFVLLYCLIMTSLSRGSGESFGVFLLPLSSHFSWDRASVASIYSVYMVSLGLGSLLSGIVFDKFGPRFNYMFGMGLLAIAYGFLGNFSSIWQFYIVLGVFGGIGAAMVGVIPAQSLVSRWFDKNLGSALSIAYAGQGLGVLIMAPLSQISIDNFGWQNSYTYISYVFIFLFIAASFVPWKLIAKGAKNNPRGTQNGKAVGGISLIEAIKTKTFWGFFFIFGFTAVGIFGISLQIVAYLIFIGFSEVQSALSFGIAGILNFAGMILTGLAADRWPRHIVATISYILSFIAIISLALMQLYPSIFLLILFILGFGLSAGARGPIITTLIAEIFAGKGLASIYGATNLGQGFGAAAGAILAGSLFDLTGEYNFGFLLCSVFTLLGAILFWTVPHIRYAKV